MHARKPRQRPALAPTPTPLQAQDKADEAAQQASHRSEEEHKKASHAAGARAGTMLVPQLREPAPSRHPALPPSAALLTSLAAPRPPKDDRHSSPPNPTGQGHSNIGAKMDEMKHSAQAQMDKARQQ